MAYSTRTLLLGSGLHARREEGPQRTADGDRGKGLPVSMEREQRRGQTAGQKDERAESVVLEVVSHIVNGGLDDRRRALYPLYIRSGTGIPSSSSAPTIVLRNTSAHTARRCRSASSFSLRIGYLW